MFVRAQVAQSTKADDLAHRQVMRLVQRARCWNAPAPSHPLHQMASSRVSHRNEAIEVYVIGLRIRRQCVERGDDVLISAGIAATTLVDAAVFNVPNRNALCSQRTGNIAELPDAFKFLDPAAPMHQYRDRKRAIAGWFEYFDILRRGAA